MRCDIFNGQQRKLKREGGRQGGGRFHTHVIPYANGGATVAVAAAYLRPPHTPTHTHRLHTYTIRCVAVPMKMKMKMFANQKASLPSFSYATQRKRVREEVEERDGCKGGHRAHTAGDCIEVYTIVTRIHFKRFMRSLLLFLLPAARSLSLSLAQFLLAILWSHTQSDTRCACWLSTGCNPPSLLTLLPPSCVQPGLPWLTWRASALTVNAEN